MSAKEKKVKSSYLCAFLVIASLLSSLFLGCPLYTMAAFKHEQEGEKAAGQQLGAEPLDVFSDQLQVTLGWDPSLSVVDSYKILFRVHGTADWFLLSQISAVPDPQFIVGHADLGNGMFDFGIIAVDSGGLESVVHISLEVTADPDTGWYLVWER
ncbi:MAG: hypothetical protein FVQ80_16980 [Planctomycetes bacterium]|nr:hypothetical protein [Planctomycetota bacterium]